MNESTVDLDKALNELQAYVDGFVKKNPRSKADRYFKELEKSIDKKEPIGLLREISAKLRHAFPTGNEYEVKDLFEKLFDCLQVVDDPTGQEEKKGLDLDEKERMAQKTTYTFSELQKEMKTLIQRYKSAMLQEKYTAFEGAYEVVHVNSSQEGAADQLKRSAYDLRYYLVDRKHNVSTECDAFLLKLINEGVTGLDKETPMQPDQLLPQERSAKPLGSKTVVQVTSPEVSHKGQVFATQYQGNQQSSPNSAFLQSLHQSLIAKDFDAKKVFKDIQPGQTLEEELLKSVIGLKEENAGLSQSNAKINELEAHLKNATDTVERQKNESTERENYLINKYEEMQSKMMTEFENTKSNLGKKVREAREEADNWKTQWEMMAEDNTKQRQRSGEEIQRLQGENRQLKSRVSELAGAKLMDNNPDIADLSDPNRAMKLGERFSSLYDDDWTDGYQIFTEKFKLSEEAAIRLLLDILLKVYEFCKRVADEQMDYLCNIFEHPCQDIPQALTMRPQKEKVQMTQKQHKELKDLRKQIALSKVSNITKQYMTKEAEEVKQRGDKTEKSMFEKTRDYHQKCVEVCWPMVLHDPPLHMDQTVKPGVKIDGNRFRLYGGKGDILEYLVWPCLLVQGGGLISRGVAKPTKSAKGVKKS